MRPCESGTHGPITHRTPHLLRFREDLELAHKIGSTSFRFSFEWARIEPRRGVVDKQAVKRCDEGV